MLGTFVDPIEVTVIIYIDVSNTLCKVDFKISSEFPVQML